MNLTPQQLLDRARCYTCIPKGRERSVIIYLISQWANHQGPPPVCDVVWEPGIQSVTWEDSGGSHFGNLATFTATADFASVTVMEFSGLGLLSDLTGLQCLPNLEELYVTGDVLTSLDAHGLTALEILDCFDNQLTLLNVSGCTALRRLDCSSNQLGTINITGDFSIEVLIVSDNPGPISLIGP